MRSRGGEARAAGAGPRRRPRGVRLHRRDGEGKGAAARRAAAARSEDHPRAPDAARRARRCPQGRDAASTAAPDAPWLHHGPQRGRWAGRCRGGEGLRAAPRRPPTSRPRAAGARRRSPQRRARRHRHHVEVHRAACSQLCPRCRRAPGAPRRRRRARRPAPARSGSTARAAGKPASRRPRTAATRPRSAPRRAEAAGSSGCGETVLAEDPQRRPRRRTP